LNVKILKRKWAFLTKPVVKYVLKENDRRLNQYAKAYDRMRVKKNTILYESRDGSSISDSPYALFKYMLEDPRFKEYTHIWSIKDAEALSIIMNKYRHYPNVEFVKRNSKAYLKCLATCEYLINNSTFQSFFISKPEQKYINTWHGTPLKSMGFDIPGNPAHSQNVVRNFLSADYLLSPNSHTTRMFTDSYKLKGVYEGEIIEAGYPRIDLTFKTDPGVYRGFLEKSGVKLGDHKKNILYAPTWKGSGVGKVNDDIPQILADTAYLEEQVGEEYNILIKVHPFLYKEAMQYPEMSGRLIPDYVDTNELLAAVDILITDYSSIFFDYLVTNKPILFYTWDADSYHDERGNYFTTDELPGPSLFDPMELAEAIKNIDQVKSRYQKQYSKMKGEFTKYDDGNVSERVADYIFNKKKGQLNILSNLNSHKKRILIYPGGMKNNGITSSFINLMNNIDFNQYDVSCFIAPPKSKEALHNLEKVNKQVRFLFKTGGSVYKLLEVYQDKFIYNRGKRGFLGEKLFPEDAYRREHARLFGKTHFDYVIDFSGYSLFWAKYLIVSDSKKKICFMHNDLLSDSERTIHGKRPHRIHLRGLFTLYNRFDKLVSVSKGTMELNRQNLSEYADFNKFDYVLNSINPATILQSEKEEEKNDFGQSIKNFKARAVLKNLNHYPVWRLLPGQPNAKASYLRSDYHQAEIVISRKAEVDGQTFYKFSHHHQMMGWVDSRAITLLCDTVLYEQKIDKLAKIKKPNGHIWTKPYKVKGAKKVSGSMDYKDVLVHIDREAKTQHGYYYRIVINEEIIGWMDRSAFSVLEEWTINDRLTSTQKLKIKMVRKALKAKNDKQKARFLDHLENRTLHEINITRRFYARIVHTDPAEIIWTKAYPNVNAKHVTFARDFEGAIVRVEKIHRTKEGRYFLFSIDHEQIGWLNAKAFRMVKEPVILEEKEVSKLAEIRIGDEAFVWPSPPVLAGAERMHMQGWVGDGRLVKVDKEVTTQAGIFLHIIHNNTSLGWISQDQLVTKKVLGFQVGQKFIPEPSQENINFVNMGRLSPEKGQDNLIRAFAHFHSRYSNSKLYILGQGPLREGLQALIDGLQLNDSVHLLGQLEHPFGFMKKCDCFVLSSHYEGQPMVLLEAMTLEMKIIATDIVANRTVLEDGKYGLLVENSIAGLKEGLYSLVSQETIFNEKFDYAQYNSLAMTTFYKCLR
jgi:CDP-glycerol glycerophosphotransferase